MHRRVPAGGAVPSIGQTQLGGVGAEPTPRDVHVDAKASHPARAAAQTLVAALADPEFDIGRFVCVIALVSAGALADGRGAAAFIHCGSRCGGHGGHCRIRRLGRCWAVPSSCSVPTGRSIAPDIAETFGAATD